LEYKVNFHETFPVTFEYISKILEISNGNRDYTKEEISNITGIPTGASSGKVVPHIKYAEFMNLVGYEYSDKKYLLKRTELGEAIYHEDPYFTENITYKLLNYFLTSSVFGAEMWSLFYRNLMKNYKNILTRDIIQKEMIKKYGEKVNISPLLATYKNNETKFNVLRFEDEEIIKNKQSIEIDCTFIYGYTLLKEWENCFDDVEITINQLESIYWKEGFGFSIEEEFKALNLLEENDLIKLNKQLSPITIIKLKNSKNCISKLYSLLI
jgi:hypothetical protein